MSSHCRKKPSDRVLQLSLSFAILVHTAPCCPTMSSLQHFDLTPFICHSVLLIVHLLSFIWVIWPACFHFVLCIGSDHLSDINYNHHYICPLLLFQVTLLTWSLCSLTPSVRPCASGHWTWWRSWMRSMLTGCASTWARLMRRAMRVIGRYHQTLKCTCPWLIVIHVDNRMPWGTNISHLLLTDFIHSYCDRQGLTSSVTYMSWLKFIHILSSNISSEW